MQAHRSNPAAISDPLTGLYLLLTSSTCILCVIDDVMCNSNVSLGSRGALLHKILNSYRPKYDKTALMIRAGDIEGSVPIKATKDAILTSKHYQDVSEHIMGVWEERYEFDANRESLLILAGIDDFVGGLLYGVMDEEKIGILKIHCVYRSAVFRSSIAEEFNSRLFERFKSKHADICRYTDTIGVQGKHYAFGEYDDNEKYLTFVLEFIKLFGFPPKMCNFRENGNSVNMVVKGNAILFEIYRSICKLHYGNPFAAIEAINNLNHFHNNSSASFARKYVALEYDLVQLDSPREFCRVQKEKELELRHRLPVYWFDPNDFPQINLIDEFYCGEVKYDLKNDLQNALAIEDEWNDANYVVRYTFPASALFLKCKVETQKTRYGGGFEYIYLNNANNLAITAGKAYPTQATITNI